jgi:hypothetical protein
MNKICLPRPALRSSLPIAVSIILEVCLCAFLSFGQSVYSYVDENGIRVFTNIPPKNIASPSSPEMKVIPSQSPAVKSTDTPKTEPARKPAAVPKPQPDLKVASRLMDPVLSPIIEKYSAEYQLDPSLVRSIISTESAFNPGAVSPKGARGLMQLMPATAARLGVKNIHDPEENIKGGTKHLRTLLDTFNNDLELSLAAYNAGENLVARLGRVPNIPETSAYVKTVARKYGNLQMKPQTPVVAEVKPVPVFRFTDSQGTLHLTNIPPATQSASGFAPFALTTAGP